VVVLVDIVLVGMGYIEVASSFEVDFAIAAVAYDSFVEDDTFVDRCNYYTPLVVVVADLKQDFVYLLREMVN
jgi:hypothetical protein